MLPASDALEAPCWTAAEMEERSSWRFEADGALVQDAQALLCWAAEVQDPVAELRQDTLVLPAVKELAVRLARELDSGTGLAWVRGLSALSEPKLRLLYLALGLEMGTVVETYGRLCDVADSGGSYKDKPIPVSRTRESTGMHTDSSSKTVCPRLIGLLCVRQALRGGNSRVVSAAGAHEQLRSRSLRLLERLYGEYVRDVVTPGADRDPKRVAANRFPIFSWDRRLRLRYMRYWIERGHARAGLPLAPEDLAAFDALDAALADERNALTFRMAPSEMLFIDNTTIAHDRDAYDDDPTALRLMVRLWLDRPVPAHDE